MNIERKKEKWTLKRWKDEAWKWCSIYNRRKNTDWRGYGSCCTCMKQMHWSEGQAGHFMAGRTNAILFEDNGIHLQCANCNRNSGEQYLYGKFMERTYGEKETKRIERLRHKSKKYTVEDYIKIIEDYQEKISHLDEE